MVLSIDSSVSCGWTKAITLPIKVGDVWMSYDSFEPFNTIMAMVIDTGGTW